MIILVGSEKGGVGKTTIASNIAVALKNRTNKEVIVVDSDKQASLADWISYREELTNVPTIHCVQRYGNVKSTIQELANKYDYIIIDVAGRDSQEMRSSMLIAELMITPLRASQLDINTIPKLNGLIKEVKDFNDKLCIKAVLSIAPTNPSINEVTEAKNLLKDFNEFTLLQTVIRERKIYRDAINQGYGVVEMNNPKATDEILGLIQEINII